MNPGVPGWERLRHGGLLLDGTRLATLAREVLGDNGVDCWGIRYSQGDFNMTSDSRLFPPRPEWEAKGYRPDEYGRWLFGEWRSIGELWDVLGVDSSRPEPAEAELEDWLFDTTADPERREAEAWLVQPLGVFGATLRPIGSIVVSLVYESNLGFFESGDATLYVMMGNKDLCLERRAIWILTFSDHGKVGAARIDSSAIDIFPNRSLT